MNGDDLKNHVSETACSWLSSKVSLTKRLGEFTRNQISHHLLYDAWGSAPDIAYLALHLDAKSQTWIRRMQWKLRHEIWVACTVVIPVSSFITETDILKKIGKKSIGDILFRDSTLQRSDFEFIKERDEKNNIIWTRYSIFYYQQKPLLIVESFMDAFFRAIECS